jgi:hypothetical protein
MRAGSQTEWELFIMSLRNLPHTESPDRRGNRANPVYCFSVTVKADPGLMLRIMELWAKRGLVPDRWHGEKSEMETGDVRLYIETSDFDFAAARHVAESIRGVFGVTQVVVCEKQIAATA